MIAFVRGPVANVGLTSAVVDVAGVGIEVRCTPHTLAGLRRGEPATLATSMVVREDSMTLYGFRDDDEKALFELLLGASGVGPKLAQAMLAVHSPDALRRALSGEDVKALTRVPGIGQKGAQRIILELKDKVDVADVAVAAGSGPAEAAWRRPVREGLMGLGWSAKEAETAIDRVSADMGPEPDVAAVLRAALRSLSKA